MKSYKPNDIKIIIIFYLRIKSILAYNLHYKKVHKLYSYKKDTFSKKKYIENKTKNLYFC